MIMAKGTKPSQVNATCQTAIHREVIRIRTPSFSTLQACLHKRLVDGASCTIFSLCFHLFMVSLKLSMGGLCVHLRALHQNTSSSQTRRNESKQGGICVFFPHHGKRRSNGRSLSLSCFHYLCLLAWVRWGGKSGRLLCDFLGRLSVVLSAVFFSNRVEDEKRFLSLCCAPSRGYLRRSLPIKPTLCM